MDRCRHPVKGVPEASRGCATHSTDPGGHFGPYDSSVTSNLASEEKGMANPQIRLETAAWGVEISRLKR